MYFGKGKSWRQTKDKMPPREEGEKETSEERRTKRKQKRGPFSRAKKLQSRFGLQRFLQRAGSPCRGQSVDAESPVKCNCSAPAGEAGRATRKERAVVELRARREPSWGYA
jgi:hypothetical protein